MRRLPLFAFVVLIGFPHVAPAQQETRQAMLRSPFGQVIKCDKTAVFTHGTATTLFKYEQAEALFTLKLLRGDANNDQVFQIGCRDASGQLGWFAERTPGRFSWSTSEPSPDDPNTLFVAHVNPGPGMRVYIKAPSGDWFSFHPFNALRGPFAATLVPASSDRRYNFELYYENEFPVKYLRSTIDCLSVPCGDAQGYCALVHERDPESWVRGKASLNLDTSVLKLEMKLETDSNGAGPIGKMSVTLLDSSGNRLATVAAGPVGIGGKGPATDYRARTEVVTGTASVPSSVLSRVISIEVSVQRTGVMPGVLGIDGVGIGNIIDAAKVILSVVGAN